MTLRNALVDKVTRSILNKHLAGLLGFIKELLDLCHQLLFPLLHSVLLNVVKIIVQGGEHRLRFQLLHSLANILLLHGLHDVIVVVGEHRLVNHAHMIRDS